MEFETLRRQVYQANMQLPQYKLVTFTWGNVSQVDRDAGVFAIKPSGVEYETLRPEDIVVLDFSGNVVSGNLRPSSDTKTHLELYRAFQDIGGVVHTHSPYAVAWAQACQDIPCSGTTHADYFYGDIPCARALTSEEIDQDYEKNTGLTIVSTFQERALNPTYVPGVVCAYHGPFAWGKNADQAVYHAVVMEQVAKMAILTKQVCGRTVNAPTHYQDKHFMRKHGKHAYYGQNNR